MIKIASISIATAIAAAGFFVDPVASINEGTLTTSEAHAYDNDRGQTRRIARRTARRVERRHDRLEKLPPNCASVIVHGTQYWNCANTYYQPIVQSGKTVYVIVTP